MNSRESFDAVVIGGGPAGTTAATLLAQKKRNVVLLEKEKFPRYKIGESLIPFCYFPLERIGMIEKLKASAFVKKHSVQFVGPNGKSSQPFYFSDHFQHEANTTWQVSRGQFDQMMMDNARDKGVKVIESVKAKRTICEDGVVKGVIAVDRDGQELTFRAPITIDCSGRDGFVMNRNRWRVPEKDLQKTAIWTYFKGAKRDKGRDEGATTVAFLPQKGWFWYIPLADDLVSVGAVANRDYLFSETRDLKTILWREIKKNPWIHDHVAQGRQTGEYQAIGDYSYRSKYIAQNGLVLAGDAFSFLDPVFSSGVFLAVTSGAMVADEADRCLDLGDYSADQFAAYAEKYREAIEVMRKFVYAFYNLDFNMKTVLEKYPHLGRSVTDCLIGNVFQDLDPLFEAFSEFSDIPEPLEHGLPCSEEALVK